MKRKTYKARIVRDGSACYIPVPFDPAPIFGKVRAPVKVTLNGHTFRSTIASMGGTICIPFRKSNREAAGLEGGETLEITLELDAEERRVDPPPDFAVALKQSPLAWDRWQQLSYTHRREYVEAIEAAKKAETRQRRIRRAISEIAGRNP
jgi:Bacteriocin-protection, YdeI or OmpD-Associated/Domain of unknown function (DUF1905)